MGGRRHEVMKDRRDIGKVVFPIEKLLAAREISSCCVGSEALLDADASLNRAGSLQQGSLAARIARLFRRDAPTA